MLSRTLFVDIDGVLLDVTGLLCRLWNDQASLDTPLVEPQHIHNYDFSPAFSEEFVSDAMPKLWLDCQMYPKAIAFMTSLDKWCQDNRWNLRLWGNLPLHLASTLPHKMNLIQSHLPDLVDRTIVMPNKHIVVRPNDICIDDSPAVLSQIRAIGARGIVLDRPWNSVSSTPSPPKDIPRAHTYWEVFQILKA